MTSFWDACFSLYKWFCTRLKPHLWQVHLAYVLKNAPSVMLWLLIPGGIIGGLAAHQEQDSQQLPICYLMLLGMYLIGAIIHILTGASGLHLIVYMTLALIAYGIMPGYWFH